MTCLVAAPDASTQVDAKNVGRAESVILTLDKSASSRRVASRPRPSREEFAVARYHVTDRMGLPATVVSRRRAAEAFERSLGEATERLGWQIHA